MWHTAFKTWATESSLETQRTCFYQLWCISGYQERVQEIEAVRREPNLIINSPRGQVRFTVRWSCDVMCALRGKSLSKTPTNVDGLYSLSLIIYEKADSSIPIQSLSAALVFFGMTKSQATFLSMILKHTHTHIYTYFTFSA